MSRWPFLRLHREHFLMLTLSRSSALLNVSGGGYPPVGLQLNSSNIQTQERLWFVLRNANFQWMMASGCRFLCQMTFAEHTSVFVVAPSGVSYSEEAAEYGQFTALKVSHVWQPQQTNSNCSSSSWEALIDQDVPVKGTWGNFVVQAHSFWVHI